MASVNKIDSNITGLRYTKEESIGVLPAGTPVWTGLEPNSYDDFGGSVTTVARNPINPSRQRQKGVITDLDASGGFNTDLTQTNLQDLLQGFFFAALRKKGELSVATVSATDDEFQPAAGGAFFSTGDLLFAKGFDDPINNGLHIVTGTPDATGVGVTTALVDAATQLGTISCVGLQMGSAMLDVDVTGTWPRLTRASGTMDFTRYGLVPGEWIYIGGDGAALKFTSVANNGYARIRRVAATYLEFDKTQGTMINETGTGKTIQLFFGRVLKNETGANIVRSSYQLERDLGAPDDSSSNTQAEYLIGAVPNELTINIETADKVTVDLSFVGIDSEQAEAGSLKAGTRPAISQTDAFNTSSDFSRIKMAIYTEGSAAPSPLFAFVTEATITINNNVSPNKAVAVLGAFDITAGTFEVGGDITAYFANVTAVNAVRANSDITLDMHLVKQNAGISIDIPLITLGEGRPEVEQDEPITLPLEMAAASGAGVDALMDHTALIVFFDYLPDLADS